MEESIYFFEQSLELKRKDVSEMSNDILNLYVLLASENTKLGMNAVATSYYESVLNISRVLSGDYSQQTAYHMV